MEIFWLGQAAFRIKGKQVTVVTDPYDSKMIGLSALRATADMVTVSHEHGDHNNVVAIKTTSGGAPKILRGPGEYEIAGVSINGIKTWHDESLGSERGTNTVYVIDVDGVKVAHLGDLGHKLTEEQLAEIGDVDILLIPAGGYYTIEPSVAAEVVAQIEPKVVIPMHYQIVGLAPQIFEKLASVDEFIKALGATPKTLPSYQCKVESLPQEMEVVVLERKS
ncbi:MBL fold metallo-hydrolase [Candidatus Microgenomates bacterium]|nr:MBL fold metallo-hydrolase [Candidatus Microgenomates bacterium]